MVIRALYKTLIIVEGHALPDLLHPYTTEMQCFNFHVGPKSESESTRNLHSENEKFQENKVLHTSLHV